MDDHQPGGRGRGESRLPGGAEPGGRAAVRSGYWFPLLLSGGLAVLSLPLSVLASPGRPATGIYEFIAETYPTVTQVMYW